MLPSLLITFRETIEAALVIGFIFTILNKTGKTELNKYVWYGIAAGIIVSALLALIIEIFFGVLPDSYEALFEGILMFITAAFITWMILWIHRQKNTLNNLKTKLKTHIDKGYTLGIIMLTSSAIIREGTETVLYLKTSSVIGITDQLTGGILGILTALTLSFILGSLASKINIKHIFNFTSIFLILFAAGLISHGIHEFQELGIVPVFRFDPVYNITSFIDHSGGFGSILRSLFGFSSRPTLLEIISYAIYLGIIIKILKIRPRSFQKA